MLWSPIWARNEQFLWWHFLLQQLPWQRCLRQSFHGCSVQLWQRACCSRELPHISDQSLSPNHLCSKAPPDQNTNFVLGEQTYLPRPLITSSLVASNNPDSLQASSNLTSHSTSHLVINHQSSGNGHILSRLLTPAGLKLKEQQGRKCASQARLLVKLLGRQSIRGHSSPMHFRLLDRQPQWHLWRTLDFNQIYYRVNSFLTRPYPHQWWCRHCEQRLGSWRGRCRGGELEVRPLCRSALQFQSLLRKYRWTKHKRGAVPSQRLTMIIRKGFTHHKKVSPHCQEQSRRDYFLSYNTKTTTIKVSSAVTIAKFGLIWSNFPVYVLPVKTTVHLTAIISSVLRTSFIPRISRQYTWRW